MYLAMDIFFISASDWKCIQLGSLITKVCYSNVATCCNCSFDGPDCIIADVARIQLEYCLVESCVGFVLWVIG